MPTQTDKDEALDMLITASDLLRKEEKARPAKVRSSLQKKGPKAQKTQYSVNRTLTAAAAAALGVLATVTRPEGAGAKALRGPTTNPFSPAGTGDMPVLAPPHPVLSANAPSMPVVPTEAGTKVLTTEEVQALDELNTALDKNTPAGEAIDLLQSEVVQKRLSDINGRASSTGMTVEDVQFLRKTVEVADQLGRSLQTACPNMNAIFVLDLSSSTTGVNAAMRELAIMLAGGLNASLLSAIGFGSSVYPQTPTTSNIFSDLSSFNTFTIGIPDILGATNLYLAIPIMIANAQAMSAANGLPTLITLNTDGWEDLTTEQQAQITQVLQDFYSYQAAADTASDYKPELLQVIESAPDVYMAGFFFPGAKGVSEPFMNMMNRLNSTTEGSGRFMTAEWPSDAISDPQKYKDLMIQKLCDFVTKKTVAPSTAPSSSPTRIDTISPGVPASLSPSQSPTTAPTNPASPPPSVPPAAIAAGGAVLVKLGLGVLPRFQTWLTNPRLVGAPGGYESPAAAQAALDALTPAERANTRVLAHEQNHATDTEIKQKFGTQAEAQAFIDANPGAGLRLEQVEIRPAIPGTAAAPTHAVTRQPANPIARGPDGRLLAGGAERDRAYDRAVDAELPFTSRPIQLFNYVKETGAQLLGAGRSAERATGPQPAVNEYHVIGPKVETRHYLVHSDARFKEVRMGALPLISQLRMLGEYLTNREIFPAPTDDSRWPILQGVFHHVFRDRDATNHWLQIPYSDRVREGGIHIPAGRVLAVSTQISHHAGLVPYNLIMKIITGGEHSWFWGAPLASSDQESAARAVRTGTADDPTVRRHGQPAPVAEENAVAHLLQHGGLAPIPVVRQAAALRVTNPGLSIAQRARALPGASAELMATMAANATAAANRAREAREAAARRQQALLEAQEARAAGHRTGTDPTELRSSRGRVRVPPPPPGPPPGPPPAGGKRVPPPPPRGTGP